MTRREQLRSCFQRKARRRASALDPQPLTVALAMTRGVHRMNAHVLQHVPFEGLGSIAS